MAADEQKHGNSVTKRAFVLGLLLSAFFAWLGVLLDNISASDRRRITETLIPALPYVMLLIAGVLVNPLLKRLRMVRVFTKAELLLIFVMTIVSSGIATWGLSGTLVPLVSGLSNPEWNTEQSRWDVTVMPFLNENYFIAERGTHAASLELREVYLAHNDARTVYQRASDLLLCREDLERIDAELEGIARLHDAEDRESRERALFWPRIRAVQLVESSTEAWERVGKDLDPQLVVATYGAKIAAFRHSLQERRKALRELNAEAFQQVELIRHGLPRGKRAHPGFFFSRQEGWLGYTARIKRYRIGRTSLQVLRRAEAQLARAIEENRALPADWPDTITEAADRLEPISALPELIRLHDKRSAELASLDQAIVDQRNLAWRLRHLRRFAVHDQFTTFD